MVTAAEYTASLVEWAVIYAAGDLPVFPVWGPFKKNACQCKDGAHCKRPGKHPMGRLVPNGLNDATTDETTIRRWWAEWPRANVGIAVPPGYVVLDIDGAEGLEAIAARGWKIPTTTTAATGRGWHHWFLADVEIRPGSGFMTGVDMRGPGGYVVAPPSLHASCAQYEWDGGFSGYFADAPAWLFQLVREAREQHRQAPEQAPEGPITEGGRNDTLARIGGAMRRWGCSQRAILAALQVTNEDRCRPMLEDDEVELIASSVARYAPERVDVDSPWARKVASW